MANINYITPEELSNIKKPAASGVLVMTNDGEFLLTKRTAKAEFLGGHCYTFYFCIELTVGFL